MECALMHLSIHTTFPLLLPRTVRGSPYSPPPQFLLWVLTRGRKRSSIRNGKLTVQPLVPSHQIGAESSFFLKATSMEAKDLLREEGHSSQPLYHNTYTHPATTQLQASVFSREQMIQKGSKKQITACNHENNLSYFPLSSPSL